MTAVRGKKELREKRLEILKWLAAQGQAVTWSAVRERFNLPYLTSGNALSHLIRHWWFITQNGTVWVSEKGFLQLRGVEDPSWRHPSSLKLPEERAETARKAMIRRKKREGAVRAVKLKAPCKLLLSPQEQKERDARIEEHRKRAGQQP